MDRIEDALPPYYTLEGDWKIGNFAYRSNRQVLFDANTCFNWNNEYNTPSSHFRRYIKRVQFAKKNPPDYVSYPFYAKPCKLPKGVYLDISQAYRQIGNVLGCEVHYKEGRHMAFGEKTFNDDLFDLKLMRGLIVSATGEKGKITRWVSKRNELSQEQFTNDGYAPHLRIGIFRMLHAIAASVKPYIVYFHTDGMIVPSHFLSRVEDILNSWFVSTKVKEYGLTIVKQRGVYSIGSHKTSQFEKFKISSSDYINTQNVRWYHTQYVKGIELRNNLNYGLELL